MGKAARIMAIPAAHHRMNYIHPFPDGNGRVSRLMNHAMAHAAGSARTGFGRSRAGLRAALRAAKNTNSIWIMRTCPVRAISMAGAIFRCGR